MSLLKMKLIEWSCVIKGQSFSVYTIEYIVSDLRSVSALSTVKCFLKVSVLTADVLLYDHKSCNKRSIEFQNPTIFFLNTVFPIGLHT